MGLDRGVHEVSGARGELALRTTVLRGNQMRVIRGNATPRTIDGLVRVFMVAQPVGAVTINIARPYVSLT